MRYNNKAVCTAGEFITLNLDKGRRENRQLIEIRKDRVEIPSTRHEGLGMEVSVIAPYATALVP
jgi:hypothetical protein